MSRRRTDTLDSYEGIPLGSPERRTIQSRNAQRVYRAKKMNRTRIETPRPGQAPALPAEPQSNVSSSVSSIATPSPPPPTFPESQTKYNNGTTTVGPFPSPKLFDLGIDDLIDRMLVDDPSCSTLDPYGIESISLGESSWIDAPLQLVPASPESNELSQHSSRSASADIASCWGVDDFSSDFNPSYRAGDETASPSANALTSWDVPPLQSASNTVAAPQNLIIPNTVATRTLPRSPTSPISSYPTPPYQNCAPGTNTPNAFREEDQLSGCGVGRHPIHTAAQNGHTRIIQLLLQSGCDVNLKDGIGSTPIHVSASEGHAEAIRLLINHGSDINAVNNLGWTPIHLATRNGHTDCVELLLKLRV